MNIRYGHVEDGIERVPRCINGLRYDIQDEISILNLKIVEDEYQVALKVEEKFLRKQNQRNRGKNMVRGIGFPNRGGRNFKYESKSSSSSVQSFQGGIFGGGGGRGRSREVRCYTCGETGHMSWDCPRNKSTGQRDVNVAEAQEEAKEETEVDNPPKDGEALMLKRVLVNTEKQAHEQAQRKSLFRTRCKSEGKCCKMVIDSGSTDNLVSKEMVEKLGLKRMKNPTPYKVS